MKRIILLLLGVFLGYLTLSYFLKKDKIKTYSVNLTSSAIQKNVDPEILKVNYALMRFGSPKYPKDFKNFNYANVNAPKGGSLKLATVGSFDRINYATLKGRAAEGLNLTRDNLMVNAKDEPLTKYGLLAHSFYLEKDFSKITFFLRTNALFHNNENITAHDLKTTIQTLREWGIPAYRNYYKHIKNIIIHNDYKITFEFIPRADGTYDPMMPMVMASLSPISRKQLDKIDFANFNQEPLITSGPYIIKSFESGKRIIYKKNQNYWGENINVNRGVNNFDHIQIDYYKDDTALFEAFKKGLFDIWFCSDVKQFHELEFKSDNFEKLAFKHNLPVAVQSILFNMHKTIFQNRNVRKAIAMAFDFDCINRMYFDGGMKAAKSIFENTRLAHQNTIIKKEQEILEHFKKDIPQDVWQEMFNRTIDRKNRTQVLKEAERLLDEAGFKFRNHQTFRSNEKGEKLILKLIIRKKRFEKILNLFTQDLKKIGVHLHILFAEESIYRKMEDNRDYDMMIYTWANSAQPGIELLSYFGQNTAHQKGSSNYIGLDDKVADKMAKRIAHALNENDLLTSVRAFDRYIISQYYLIPVDYSDAVYLVYRKDRIDFTKNPHAGIDVMQLGWALKTGANDRT